MTLGGTYWWANTGPVIRNMRVYSEGRRLRCLSVLQSQLNPKSHNLMVGSCSSSSSFVCTRIFVKFLSLDTIPWLCMYLMPLTFLDEEIVCHVLWRRSPQSDFGGFNQKSTACLIASRNYSAAKQPTVRCRTSTKVSESDVMFGDDTLMRVLSHCSLP